MEWAGRLRVLLAIVAQGGPEMWPSRRRLPGRRKIGEIALRTLKLNRGAKTREEQMAGDDVRRQSWFASEGALADEMHHNILVVFGGCLLRAFRLGMRNVARADVTSRLLPRHLARIAMVN
jgi:hypothetical protein